MKLTFILFAGTLFATASANAVVAVSGRPVPEMAVFDNIMTTYMEANSVGSGVLGIMRQGKVVYQRGFGTLTPGVNTPENVTFRIASLSKAITAAAIRMMAADGAFGAQGIDRNAFNLLGNGGLLNLTPWPSLSDNDIASVTLRNLLDHTSGFPKQPDTVFRDDSRLIATTMNLGRPPTNAERIRAMLGRVHAHSVGTFDYSNFNYLVLGYIVETMGGGYVTFIHDRVLTAAGWIPASEVQHGRTLAADRFLREPLYGSSGTGESVFDYSAPLAILPTPYGGEYDMDALLGSGSLVVSAPAMLDFGNRFHLWYPNAGVPVTGSLTDDGHDGGLAGFSTKLETLSSDIVIFIALNKDATVGPVWAQIKGTIQAATAFTWPATTSDGHWISVPAGDPTAGFGSYDAPWQGFGSSLPKADAGSRLRLKAGTSNWTGTITKRMKLDAPTGTARLGVP